MHECLISYLKDNRDQIIETWLLEAEIPPLNSDSQVSDTDQSGVPVEFLANTFDRILNVIESGQAPAQKDAGLHLNDLLGVSCTCKQRVMGGRVCLELHDSGLVAFTSVLGSSWDAATEFNEFDREDFIDLINHALSGVVGLEVENCHYKNFRPDCPFASDAPNSSSSN